MTTHADRSREANAFDALDDCRLKHPNRVRTVHRSTLRHARKHHGAEGADDAAPGPRRPWKNLARKPRGSDGA